SDNARNRIYTAASGSDISGVSITPEGGADVIKPDEVNQLTQQGNEMIKDFLAGTFLDYKPGADYTPPEQEPELKTELAQHDGKKYGHDGIDRYNLKTWDESMSATFRFNLTEKSVVDSIMTVDDNLSNLLAGHSAKEFRTQVDIDASFYKYLD